jgi:anti-anti-sigma regulatory factor
MVASKSITFRAAERLSHAEACRLSGLAARSVADTVVIDMSGSPDASTAAFARLVLLRRELLQSGRDVRITGLRQRARQLFEVHRLDSVLPLVEQGVVEAFMPWHDRQVLQQPKPRKNAVA